MTWLAMTPNLEIVASAPTLEHARLLARAAGVASPLVVRHAVHARRFGPRPPLPQPPLPPTLWERLA